MFVEAIVSVMSDDTICVCSYDYIYHTDYWEHISTHRVVLMNVNCGNYRTCHGGVFSKMLVALLSPGVIGNLCTCSLIDNIGFGFVRYIVGICTFFMELKL